MKKIYLLISVKIVKACSGAEVLQWKLLLDCIKRFLRLIFQPIWELLSCFLWFFYSLTIEVWTKPFYEFHSWIFLKERVPDRIELRHFATRENLDSPDRSLSISFSLAFELITHPTIERSDSLKTCVKYFE